MSPDVDCNTKTNKVLVFIAIAGAGAITPGLSMAMGHIAFSGLRIRQKDRENDAVVLKCRIIPMNRDSIRGCETKACIERIKASQNRLFSLVFRAVPTAISRPCTWQMARHGYAGSRNTGCNDYPPHHLVQFPVFTRNNSHESNLRRMSILRKSLICVLNKE